MHAKCWWPHTLTLKHTDHCHFQSIKRHIFYANGKSLCAQIMTQKWHSENIDTSVIWLMHKKWSEWQQQRTNLFPLNFKISSRPRVASFFVCQLYRQYWRNMNIEYKDFALPLLLVSSATLSSYKNLSWIRINIKYQFHCEVKRLQCDRIISIEVHFFVMLVTNVD